MKPFLADLLNWKLVRSYLMHRKAPDESAERNLRGRNSSDTTIRMAIMHTRRGWHGRADRGRLARQVRELERRYGSVTERERFVPYLQPRIDELWRLMMHALAAVDTGGSSIQLRGVSR